MVKIAFDLQMGGEAVRVSLNVPAAPIAAGRLLPLFQGMAHQVIDAAVGEATARGEAVSCRAGCGACCRQLVAVSRTEARRLRALVDAMPEPRRSAIRARFGDAVARLEREGMLDEVRELDALSETQLLTMNPRYMALRIPCPFLEDESCSIHRQRPIVCREYLVTTAPEHCDQPSPTAVRTVPLAAHVSRSVVMLEGEPSTYARVPLTLALEWTDAHPDDEPPPRPAVDWINVVLLDLTGRTVVDEGLAGG
jgi:Fe-S-cluster containining protein